jgi:hypothetical protein
MDILRTSGCVHGAFEARTDQGNAGQFAEISSFARLRPSTLLRADESVLEDQRPPAAERAVNLGIVAVFRWLLFSTLLAMNLASGQRMVSAEQEPSPDKSPRSAPEQRRRWDVDPDALFVKLVSKDPRQTRGALDRVGMSWFAEREPTDVRLFGVNLDSDPELERVLVVKANLDSVALVLKKEGGVWWELGGFACCGPGSRDPDSFIELKDTVWYGIKDLIVHQGASHGTGVGEIDLAIYRVWKGHLYRVFNIVESAYTMQESESSRITYPNVDSSSAPRIIVVQRTKEMGHRTTTTCVPYRWDTARFAFVQTPATRNLCGSAEVIGPDR